MLFFSARLCVFRELVCQALRYLSTGICALKHAASESGNVAVFDRLASELTELRASVTWHWPPVSKYPPTGSAHATVSDTTATIASTVKASSFVYTRLRCESCCTGSMSTDVALVTVHIDHTLVSVAACVVCMCCMVVCPIDSLSCCSSPGGKVQWYHEGRSRQVQACISW